MTLTGKLLCSIFFWQLMSVQAYAENAVKQTCQRIAKKLASVSYQECNVGLSDTQARSVKHNPILMKEYSPISGKQPQARVLLLGGIHGDEYSSVSIVFKWMDTLDRSHSGLFHWRVIPLLNPDGLLRKKSKRTNANGVDLNRNFLTDYWYQRSQYYWVSRTGRDLRRYPGPHPLSEPESRWLAGEIATFKPDVIVAVHAPYGVLDFDGPNIPPKRLGHLHLNLLGTYPGSLGNYAGVERDIPVLTIELPSAGIMPTRKQNNAIWGDLVTWLKHNTPRKILPAQLATPMHQDEGPS